eukprot:gb/GECG01004505.1/.p1 GENE.gb/GECG01004505.1/~~gb/GECG01004505.1/.p1  ORF type:complete len:1176 (+),score=173.68 gb/GECG01004505.1/:1-3528(+)
MDESPSTASETIQATVTHDGMAAPTRLDEPPSPISSAEMEENEQNGADIIQFNTVDQGHAAHNEANHVDECSLQCAVRTLSAEDANTAGDTEPTMEERHTQRAIHRQDSSTTHSGGDRSRTYPEGGSEYSDDRRTDPMSVLTNNALSPDVIRQRLERLCLRGLIDSDTGRRVLSELLGDNATTEQEPSCDTTRGSEGLHSWKASRIYRDARQNRIQETDTEVEGNSDEMMQDNHSSSHLNEEGSFGSEQKNYLDMNDVSSVQPALGGSVGVDNETAEDDDHDTSTNQEEEDHGASDLKGSEHAAAQAATTVAGTVSSASASGSTGRISRHEEESSSAICGGHTVETAATCGSTSKDEQDTESDADDFGDEVAPLPFSGESVADSKCEGGNTVSSEASEDFQIASEDDDVSRRTQFSFSSRNQSLLNMETSTDLGDINLEAYDDDANAGYSQKGNSSVCAVIQDDGDATPLDRQELERTQHDGARLENAPNGPSDDHRTPLPALSGALPDWIEEETTRRSGKGQRSRAHSTTPKDVSIHSNGASQSVVSIASTAAQDPSHEMKYAITNHHFFNTFLDPYATRGRSVSQEDSCNGSMASGLNTNMAIEGTPSSFAFAASSGRSVLSAVGSDFGDDQGSHVEVASVEARPPTPGFTGRWGSRVYSRPNPSTENQHSHGFSTALSNIPFWEETSSVSNEHNAGVDDVENPGNYHGQSLPNPFRAERGSVGSGVSRMSTMALREGSLNSIWGSVGLDSQFGTSSWGFQDTENGDDMPRHTFEQRSLSESEPAAGANATERGYSETGSAEDQEYRTELLGRTSVRFEANPQSIDEAANEDTDFEHSREFSEDEFADGENYGRESDDNSVGPDATDRAISQASGRSLPDTDQMSQDYADGNDEKSEGAPDVMGEDAPQRLFHNHGDSVAPTERDTMEHRRWNLTKYRSSNRRRLYSPVRQPDGYPLDPQHARSLILNTWFSCRQRASASNGSSLPSTNGQGKSRKRPATARHARNQPPSVGLKREYDEPAKALRPSSACPTRQEQRKRTVNSSCFLEEDDDSEDDSRLLYVGNFQPSFRSTAEMPANHTGVGQSSESSNEDNRLTETHQKDLPHESRSTNGFSSPIQRNVIRRPIASSRLQRAIHNNKQPYTPSKPERRALQRELAEEIPELNKRQTRSLLQ